MSRSRKRDALPVLTPREERLVALLCEGNTSIAELCRGVGIGPKGHSGDLYQRIKVGDIGKHIRARMRAHGPIPNVPLLKLREKLDAKETGLSPMRARWWTRATWRPTASSWTPPSRR